LPPDPALTKDQQRAARAEERRTVERGLTVPADARPIRVDELTVRLGVRGDDPFNLPPEGTQTSRVVPFPGEEPDSGAAAIPPIPGRSDPGARCTSDPCPCPHTGALMDYFDLKAGHMHADDVPLADIAAAVGTPVYVYSAGTLRPSRPGVPRGAGRARRALIAFAVKANPNVAVLRLLGQEGFGADVVSEGEMRRALAAGIPAARIVFSGVGKTDAEMRAALEAGILQLNVESEGRALAVVDGCSRNGPDGGRSRSG
jgi:hypothetical protein